MHARWPPLLRKVLAPNSQLSRQAIAGLVKTLSSYLPRISRPNALFAKYLSPRALTLDLISKEGNTLKDEGSRRKRRKRRNATFATSISTRVKELRTCQTSRPKKYLISILITYRNLHIRRWHPPPNLRPTPAQKVYSRRFKFSMDDPGD